MEHHRPDYLVVGVRIHPSIRKILIYKFQSEISENKVYCIQSFSVASNAGSYRNMLTRLISNSEQSTMKQAQDAIFEKRHSLVAMYLTPISKTVHKATMKPKESFLGLGVCKC
ncbi:hypothetical protein V8G54_031680 [Vigna mungo]|uniref:Replication protein A 70 kDa DNA-binding subunit B/D first OB fold domain-containing protein n=1 Tax=Vigna mungo TaxID=3915 RepID=A0AAQ3RH56_VIGMU